MEDADCLDWKNQMMATERTMIARELLIHFRESRTQPTDQQVSVMVEGVTAECGPTKPGDLFPAPIMRAGSKVYIAKHAELKP